MTRRLAALPLRRRVGALLKRHPLRALDAAQLASLHLLDRTGQKVTMVTFDERLAAAARLEGVTLAGGGRKP